MGDDGFDAGVLLFVHLVDHFKHTSAVQAVVRENADEVLITRGRQGRGRGVRDVGDAVLFECGRADLDAGAAEDAGKARDAFLGDEALAFGHGRVVGGGVTDDDLDLRTVQVRQTGCGSKRKVVIRFVVDDIGNFLTAF